MGVPGPTRQTVSLSTLLSIAGLLCPFCQYGHTGADMSTHLGPLELPAAGGKVASFFTFDDPLLGAYQWPYFAVVGSEPGLSFLLTAGIHAAEYTGTLAAIRLGQSLEPRHVRGTIVVLPLLNVPGFYERSVYVNPVDNQNLN